MNDERKERKLDQDIKLRENKEENIEEKKEIPVINNSSSIIYSPISNPLKSRSKSVAVSKLIYSKLEVKRNKGELIFLDKGYINAAKKMNILSLHGKVERNSGPPRTPKVEGHLYRTGSLALRKAYRFFVLDPVQGNFSRYRLSSHYPNHPLEIIPLKTITQVTRVHQPWYQKRNYYYFEIVGNMRRLFFCKSEEHANLWTQYLNSGILYCNYINVLTEKIYSGREENKRLEIKLEECMREEQVRIILESENGILTDRIEPKKEGNLIYSTDSKERSENIYIYKREEGGKLNCYEDDDGVEDIVLMKEKCDHPQISDTHSSFHLPIHSPASQPIQPLLSTIPNNSSNNSPNSHNSQNSHKPQTLSLQNLSSQLHQDTSVNFNSFQLIHQIGNGSFGKIFKVKKKDSGKIYAMKVLNKKYLFERKQLRYAISECNILKQMDHPFILKLHYSFQTPRYLYFILDYCSKGDLAMHLEQRHVFSENESKFFIAELILAIEYLHSKDIIYRDLKPANILISQDGHIKLADFGLAKEGINRSKNALSFCGSPAYLAPEMVVRKKVGKATDIYGIGVIMYEFLCGLPPFYNDNKEKMFKQITNSKLKIPRFISNSGAFLLSKLLNRDRQERIGVYNKDELKNHSYFSNINWKSLLEKRIIPPQFDLEELDNDDDYDCPAIKNISRKLLEALDYYDKDLVNINRIPQFTFVRSEQVEKI